MLHGYCLNDSETVPVIPIIIGVWCHCVFTFHTRCVYITKSLRFKIFSVSFFTTFTSHYYYYYYYYYYYACYHLYAEYLQVYI